MGYNYFNLNALTLDEINRIVEAHNNKIKERERISRIAQQKAKTRGRHR